MPATDDGKWITFCSFCDPERGYKAKTQAASESAASKHVDYQHPEMLNPFRDDGI